MTGLGPHAMGTGAWVALAALQLGLVVLAALGVWIALRVTRPGSGR